jgi:hypothetical protein
MKECASARKYCCSLHPEVFRVSYFPQGTEVLFLANLSKDSTRVNLERVEMDSYGFWVLWIDKLLFSLLTSGTGEHLVCQVLSACSSMPCLDVGDYKRRTELSPPTAYPSTMEYKANKGSLYPRHHVYAIDYYSSIVQGYPPLSGPSSRVSVTRTDDEPANKYK